jgi:hypothetical protein
LVFVLVDNNYDNEPFYVDNMAYESVTKTDTRNGRLVFLKGDVMSGINKPNELQEDTNKLQQEMINETKTYNRVRTTHNIVMILLTAAIVFLGVITLLTNYNKPGRYSIASANLDAVYVLDTKTSRVWLRIVAGNIYLGTNENPKREKNFLP